jgi:hypothetical protein
MILIDILSQLKQGDSYCLNRVKGLAAFHRFLVPTTLSDSLGRLKIPSARRYKKGYTDSMVSSKPNIFESGALYPLPKERGFTDQFDKGILFLITRFNG